MERGGQLRNGDRAQSESVGVILLTVVVVLVVSAGGVVYLSTVEADADKPMLSVEGAVSPPNVSVTHAGGDSVPAGELRLVVSVDGSRVHIETSEQEFTPGETWSLNVSNHANVAPGSVVGVSLYHVPSGSRLYVKEWTADEEWE